MRLARILVLADTHNHLPGNIHELSKGVHEIWHLGDVCDPGLLEELKLVGPPVTCVRGNCDSESTCPLVVDLTRHGIRFRLQHIPPEWPPENVEVVLNGHTHVPRDEMRDGVRFLNPGCVTRPNRGAPPSIAYLDFEKNGKFTWTLVRLR